MTDYLAFAYFMLRPRAIRACFRMNSFDRVCYSFDYLSLQAKSYRERHL